MIAGTLAALPIELRNGPDRKDSKQLPPSPLLKKPYAEISQRDWWVGFAWALALRGNFYGRIIQRDDLGQPVQIKPIHNDAVQIWRNRANGALIYRFYGEEIPLDDVVHVRLQTLPGEIIGLNPIQLLALSFGNAVAKERFVESYYLNSANPMGVIEVPGYLDRIETRKMLRSWVAAHQGLNKANLPAILTDNATFKPISINPSDSQLIEALNFSEGQICGRIFRVPPHMVGIHEARVSGLRGIEQLERSFFSTTMVDYMQAGMEMMTRYHRPGLYVHFDPTKRERGATLERAQAGALLMNSGVGLADEIRDWFDLPALPNNDGQHSYMPINTQLLETAIVTLQQAKAAPLLPSPVNGTVSKAQPRIPPAEGGTSVLPTRKPSPNGLPRTRMSVEEAIHVLETAISQSQRMSRAADMALRINGHHEED